MLSNDKGGNILLLGHACPTVTVVGTYAAWIGKFDTVGA